MGTQPPRREDASAQLVLWVDFLARLREQPTHGALLWVDLDATKHANAILGVETVDRLLEELAAILNSAMPPGSIVSRYAGGSFVAHVLDATRAPALSEFLRSIVETCWTRERSQLRERARMVLEPLPANVLTISVGVARYDGNAIGTLRQAKVMCKGAKRAGSNRVATSDD
jgi:diguanylate cyclase (GGDEF)-like protein